MPPQRVTLPEMSIHRWQKLLSFIIGVMASGAHSLPKPRPLACHSSSSNSSNEPPCNALICLPRCYDLFAAPANNTNVTIEMTRCYYVLYISILLRKYVCQFHYPKVDQIPPLSGWFFGKLMTLKGHWRSTWLFGSDGETTGWLSHQRFQTHHCCQ